MISGTPGRLDLRGAVIGDRLDRLLLHAPGDPVIGDADQQQPSEALCVAQRSHAARDRVAHLLLVLDRRRLTDELPRSPTGKLYKKALRDSYWAKSRSNIV